MVSIAGSEVGRPQTIADITPEWMTSVFRVSGALGPDGAVATVHTEPFAVGMGFLSELNKATMTVAGASVAMPE